MSSMDPAVLAALVASLTSLGVAGITAVRAARESRDSRALQRELSDAASDAAERLMNLEHQHKQQERERERRAEEAVQLARFREPLLDAADELRHRLNNIRTKQFLEYLKTPRHDTAIRTTLFRLARYFGVLEMLYARVNYLKFQSAEETRTVANLLAKIGKTFASDSYDRTNGFATSRFMIWREEQRAMGETAIEHSSEERPEVVGYAAFVHRLEDGASKWFASFLEDLEHADAGASTRFEHLEKLLSELVEHLGRERRSATSAGDDVSGV